MIDTAITKMSFLNIAGPIDRFDDIVSKYIADYPVELANANEIFENLEGVQSFAGPNPFDNAYKVQNDVIEQTGIDIEDLVPYENSEPISVEEAVKFLNKVKEEIEVYDQKIADLDRQINETGVIRSQLEPVKDIGVDLRELFSLKFLRFRFGRLTRESFTKLDTYLKELEVIYVKVHETSEYVWILYFTPYEYREKIDDVFSSLYFERIWISDKAYGMPEEAFGFFDHLYQHLMDEKAMVLRKKDEYIKTCSRYAAGIYRTITRMYRTFDVRKLAIRTEQFFYICGWVPEKEMKKMEPKLDAEKDIAYTIEYQQDIPELEPPVQLENKGIFKAFEWLVNMYSLPNYQEFDPTKFLAVTYILIFSIMFGDVGHGLTLFLAGIVIYRWKKIPLGLIMVPLGLASAVMGLMYGSVFGFEELIPALLIKPMSNATTINQILYTTVGLGAVIIICTMIANIINGVKQKDIGRIWFDQNGVAGLIFYGSIFAGVIAMLAGKSIFTWWYVTLFIIIPLIVIFLKEPLVMMIEKRKDKNFSYAENSFEFFEVLLSFVTNTISFVRIGAFALNHAGMLSVVFVIADMFSGAGSVIAIVVGNIIVMVLEGLVVGIQVLRLEFFEMFSRYYTGGGKKFNPLKVEKN